MGEEDNLNKMHFQFLDWVYKVLGVPGSGPYYGFWSGFGSDLTEFGIIGGFVAVYRKNNCEVHACWRIGRHRTEAGHMVCRKHHPENKLTPQDIVDAHNTALEQKDSV